MIPSGLDVAINPPTLGSHREDELPDELARRQEHPQAIKESMQRLEEQMKEKAEAKRREREQDEIETAPPGRETPGPQAETDLGQAGSRHWQRRQRQTLSRRSTPGANLPPLFRPRKKSHSRDRPQVALIRR